MNTTKSTTQVQTLCQRLLTQFEGKLVLGSNGSNDWLRSPRVFREYEEDMQFQILQPISEEEEVRDVVASFYESLGMTVKRRGFTMYFTRDPGFHRIITITTDLTTFMSISIRP